MVLDVVTNPDDFFERRANDPGWGGPALVVLVVALLSAASQIPAFRLTAAVLPPEAETFFLAIQAVTGLFTVLFTFIVWIVYGVILHVTATVGFGAEGDLWSLVKLSGWGFVPNIIGALFSTVVAFVVFGGATLPTGDDPTAVQSAIQSIQRDPLFLASTVVGVALLLWTGMLWAFAVRNARDVDLRTGLLVAAVPVGIGLLLQVGGLAFGGVL